jgi:manganese transport protein
MLGLESDDFETRNDEQRLHLYVKQLQDMGFNASGHLGFRNRSKEIARLVTDQQAELLVIGAHRHRGLKDWLYGETINSVRHEISIPVLVVNVGN